MSFKKFYVKMTESMDVSVKNLPSTEEKDTLGDISWILRREVFKRIPESHKTKMGPSMIVPDGSSDYFEPKGILNFYTSGLEEGVVEQVLKVISEVLKKYNIKHGSPSKFENSNSFNSLVIRIPIENIPGDESDRPPELNMSNANAAFIFRNILGIESPEWEKGSELGTFSGIEPFSIPVDYLLRLLDSERVKFNAGYEERPMSSGKLEGGARFINAGIDFGYIREKLNRLKEIALWAKKHGYKELSIA